MHTSKDKLPIKVQLPGVTIRSAEWNGMSATCVQLAAGSDFTPALKGLPEDMCQCVHWGYVTKGTLHLRYKDGREEAARAGDLWFAPAGHTAWCDDDCEYVDFSPEEDFERTISHVKKVTQAS